jgi:hypothetical protein
MSASGAALRSCAFGDPSARVWGAAWALAGGLPAFAVLGTPSDARAVSAQLEGEDPAGEWLLRTEDLDLVLTGASEPAPAAAESDVGGFDQLARVTGRSGVRRELACLGLRRAHGVAPSLERFDSLRDVAAWFEPGEGLAVLALRPRRAKGHGADVVSATLLEDGSATSVEDPRLSTTYSGDGRPRKAGLELWTHDEKGEERLRRAAGEALGPHAEGALGDLRAAAELFTWRVRGREGIGVYLLARRP